MKENANTERFKRFPRQPYRVLGIANIGAKCYFEIWGFKGFSIFGQEKQPLKWLLDDPT